MRRQKKKHQQVRDIQFATHEGDGESEGEEEGGHKKEKEGRGK